MSEPLPAMDQAEQDGLTRQVGRALLAVAPPGWTEIRAEYRSVGRHIEVDVTVTGPDGVGHPMRPPMEVVDGLGRMRHGMYRPGRGTWLSAVYLLEPPSSFSVEFEPDVEPRWRRLPPPIGFQDELRFYPRADQNIPLWLRQRAGLAPMPAPQEGMPHPPGAAPHTVPPWAAGPPPGPQYVDPRQPPAGWAPPQQQNG
ncbi:MAG: hypothetical protein ACJ72N_19490 [Labedaea sp.]